MKTLDRSNWTLEEKLAWHEFERAQRKLHKLLERIGIRRRTPEEVAADSDDILDLTNIEMLLGFASTNIGIHANDRKELGAMIEVSSAVLATSARHTFALAEAANEEAEGEKLRLVKG